MTLWLAIVQAENERDFVEFKIVSTRRRQPSVGGERISARDGICPKFYTARFSG